MEPRISRISADWQALAVPGALTDWESFVERMWRSQSFASASSAQSAVIPIADFRFRVPRSRGVPFQCGDRSATHLHPARFAGCAALESYATRPFRIPRSALRVRIFRQRTTA